MEQQTSTQSDSLDSRQQVAKAYSRGGQGYDKVRLADARGRILSEFDIHLFLRLFPSVPPQQPVLEVGAGTGRFTLPLLERGYRIVATDINEAMLDELRGKLQGRPLVDRCSVSRGDIFHLEFDNGQFELVYSFHVVPRLLTLADQKAALLELSRVVKPGGRLIVNYRNRRSIYGLFWKGFAPSTKEVNRILGEAGMQITTRRGKWLLSRRTLNALPLFLGRLLGDVERLLSGFLPQLAWDVVVVAVKKS